MRQRQGAPSPTADPALDALARRRAERAEARREEAAEREAIVWADSPAAAQADTSFPFGEDPNAECDCYGTTSSGETWDPHPVSVHWPAPPPDSTELALRRRRHERAVARAGIAYHALTVTQGLCPGCGLDAYAAADGRLVLEECVQCKVRFW